MHFQVDDTHANLNLFFLSNFFKNKFVQKHLDFFLIIHISLLYFKIDIYVKIQCEKNSFNTYFFIFLS